MNDKPMETLVITIRDIEKRDHIEQVLRDMEGVERIERVRMPDEVTVLAQPSLSEEWDSSEDQRWNSLL